MSYHRNQNQGMKWKSKEEIASSKKVIGDSAPQNGFQVSKLNPSSQEFRPRSKGSSSRAADLGNKLIFIPYLPQDDSRVHAEEAQEVIDRLNKELSVLLKLKPAEFWREVTSNQSLHELLESYLLFRRRWYDFSSKTDIVGGDDELCRRVFMVFFRMSTQEPGTPVGTLDILRDKEVFTISRILDICAIYGHDNVELTRRLVSEVFRLQPDCLQDVSKAVLNASSKITTVHERSMQMMNSTEKLNQKLKDELAEVVDFLYDSVMTLGTFLEIYPSAAGQFLPPATSSDTGLLSAIASVHNTLLPGLRKQYTWERLASLENGLVQLAWTLICRVFFEAEPGNSNVFGQRFVQALITLSSGSDETGTSILYSLGNRFDMAQKLQRLLQTGSIILDDSLYAHMLAVLPETQLTYVQESGKPATGGDSQEDAIRLSQISQVKDLFPDYGDGYISACLEVYDNNPEVVIQHILEGTLHPELLTLDVTMASKPVPVAEKPVQAVKDKGKGKLVDEQPQQQPQPQPQPQPQAIAVASRQGRFVRRSKDTDADAVKLLNERDAGTSSQTARLAMQILYEDEYDDSFDELDANVSGTAMEADNLVNRVSQRKQGTVSDAGQKPPVSSQKPKENRRETPLYYVKDGKHYSYKVAGSVPVASLEEAEALKKQEEDVIHGLGRGGNVPIGEAEDEVEDEEGEEDEEEEQHAAPGSKQQHTGQEGRGDGQGRGYGRGRGRGKPTKQYYVSKSHNKKDLALKKHASTLR